MIQNSGMRHPEMRPDSFGPGRPREFDIDEALDKAIDVFRQRGYQATSISDLVEGMRLSRGSVYKAFKDKRTVFLAAYDRYSAASAAGLEEAISKEKSGGARLSAVLDRYARLAATEEGQKGCLVVATAAELTTVDSEIAQRVSASFERRRKLLLRLIREGKSDGSVNPKVDERTTAELMLCLLHGMCVVGKTAPDPAAMRRVADQAMRLLG